MNQQQALPKAANFGDLALNIGVNMEIDAQLIDIGPIERTKTKGTAFQKCILKDQGGNQTKATIWQGRTGTALADINRNKWLTFNLSASKYKGENQYGGFWQADSPAVTRPPQAAPYNAPPPAQATNPVASSIVPTNKDEMICRQTAGKVAGEVVAAMIASGAVRGSEPYPREAVTSLLLELSDVMSMWFISGNAKAEEPQATQEPFDQGVCSSCQLLRADCTCPTEPFVR